MRLSFHDAAEYDPNAKDGLRVDGCIYLNNELNKGLNVTISQLDELWLPYCNIISRSGKNNIFLFFIIFYFFLFFYYFFIIFIFYFDFFFYFYYFLFLFFICLKIFGIWLQRFQFKLPHHI